MTDIIMYQGRVYGAGRRHMPIYKSEPLPSRDAAVLDCFMSNPKAQRCATARSTLGTDGEWHDVWDVRFHERRDYEVKLEVVKE